MSFTNSLIAGEAWETGFLLGAKPAANFYFQNNNPENSCVKKGIIK